VDPAVGDIQLPAVDVTAVIPAPGVEERGPLGPPPPPVVDMTQLNILSVCEARSFRLARSA